MGSRLQQRSFRHDKFHRDAKAHGFLARSVFKLQEIDQKVRLFRPGSRVCDLGCYPGSWLQYAQKKVGARGALVGLDRRPLDIALPQARILVGDVFAIAAADLLGNLGAFDVVLSDMAPDTSGVRSVDQSRSEALFERALDLGIATLGPRGHFVGKLFMGPDWKRLGDKARAHFSEVKTVKPEGSRKESIEQYVVALGKRS